MCIYASHMCTGILVGLDVFCLQDTFYHLLDECQNKYGNANAWRCCCRVFDLLTLAAVSATKPVEF